MSGSLRYAIGVLLVLSALEAVTSSDSAANRAGGLFSGAAKVLQYLISPAYPLVPDRRTAQADSSGGGGSSGGGSPIVPDPPVMLPPMPFPVV